MFIRAKILKERIAQLERALSLNESTVSLLKKANRVLASDYEVIFERFRAGRAALEEIAAQETEHANATVKRMAKIARDAL
jgi:hypothetical protein